MKLIKSLTLAASAFVALTTTMQAAQIVLNQNAIINPGAELGLGSATGNDIFSVPGWTTTGNFTSVQYGASAAPVSSPGADFGSNFFSGGPNNPTNMATQLLDVSNISTAVDAGQVVFVLSGYFGGYLFQNDSATLVATFFDASNAVISSSAVAGGFNSTARGNISQLLFDSVGGTIPTSARSVLITLTMTRTEGFYNDGYADNLSFLARSTAPLGLIPGATPEPSVLALAGLGLGVLCLLRKRRVSESV